MTAGGAADTAGPRHFPTPPPENQPQHSDKIIGSQALREVLSLLDHRAGAEPVRRSEYSESAGTLTLATGHVTDALATIAKAARRGRGVNYGPGGHTVILRPRPDYVSIATSFFIIRALLARTVTNTWS